MRHLRRRYEYIGTETRPVYNTSVTTDVEIGLSLIRVVKLEEGRRTRGEITVIGLMQYVSGPVRIRVYIYRGPRVYEQYASYHIEVIHRAIQTQTQGDRLRQFTNIYFD